MHFPQVEFSLSNRTSSECLQKRRIKLPHRRQRIGDRSPLLFLHNSQSVREVKANRVRLLALLAGLGTVTILHNHTACETLTRPKQFYSGNRLL